MFSNLIQILIDFMADIRPLITKAYIFKSYSDLNCKQYFSDQSMSKKSAVETFEIYLKSETSLVSFLPTTLFTPARDLHRERVPMNQLSKNIA